MLIAFYLLGKKECSYSSTALLSKPYAASLAMRRSWGIESKGLGKIHQNGADYIILIQFFSP